MNKTAVSCFRWVGVLATCFWLHRVGWSLRCSQALTADSKGDQGWVQCPRSPATCFVRKDYQCFYGQTSFKELVFEFPKDGAWYTGDPSHTNNPTNLFESLLQIPVLTESTCSPSFQSWVFGSYIHQVVCLFRRFLSIILRYRCIRLQIKRYTVKLVSSLQTRFKYSKFTKTGTLVKCRFLGIKPQRFGCGWPRSHTGEKKCNRARESIMPT